MGDSDDDPTTKIELKSLLDDDDILKPLANILSALSDNEGPYANLDPNLNYGDNFNFKILPCGGAIILRQDEKNMRYTHVVLTSTPSGHYAFPKYTRLPNESLRSATFRAIYNQAGYAEKDLRILA